MHHIARSSKSLGHSLKLIRIENDLTQDELAKRLNTSQKTISRIENGGLGVVFNLVFRLLSILNYEVEIRPRKVGSAQDIADMFK